MDFTDITMTLMDFAELIGLGGYPYAVGIGVILGFIALGFGVYRFVFSAKTIFALCIGAAIFVACYLFIPGMSGLFGIGEVAMIILVTAIVIRAIWILK